MQPWRTQSRGQGMSMATERASAGQGERWPLLPPLLAALGLATGLIAHWIIGTGYESQVSAVRLALLSFVSVSAIIFGFVAVRTDLIRSAVFAVGCGAVAALILYFNGATSGWSATEGWRIVCLALAIGIAAPLFQAGREGGFRPISYALAHDHAWTNGVLWCLSWAFVGVVMLLSFLLAALFDLIGIDLLKELLRKEWFWRGLVGLAFGLGLALLREQRRIVGLLQNVAMLVLGVLAPVLAVGLGLFLIALPFTGLQPLWEATKSTTPILLACAVGALLLVNAVIGNGGDDAPRNRVLRWAALVLAVAILPLVGIAAVATGLRIGQYGFTPERLWGLTFVVIASVVAVAYVISVIRGRWSWAERVRPANLHLAMIVCGIALLLATPIVSFNAISTGDQVGRLESGKVTPDKFDWAALAFDFGEPGRKALERLKRSSNSAVREKALEASKAKRRYDVVEREPDLQFTGRVQISPAGAVLPKKLKAALTRYICEEGALCRVFLQPDGQTAGILSDGCASLPAQQRADPKTSCQIYTHTLVVHKGEWVKIPLPYESPTMAPAEESISLNAERDAISRGDVTVRKVERRQLFIGDKPSGPLFE
ncbi:MAG: DUF4153 domain-containing protein [Alphaproteobacteria bacterium HGW-Alphaproteobacteria-16]|nr:MAG: DUF4153 domain-containing protein [Alphaproteobacteria bacterium HGW-Alphaproteobacteria-16]